MPVAYKLIAEDTLEQVFDFSTRQGRAQARYFARLLPQSF